MRRIGSFDWGKGYEGGSVGCAAVLDSVGKSGLGISSSAVIPGVAVFNGGAGKIQWAEGIEFFSVLRAGHAGADATVSGETFSSSLVGEVVCRWLALCRDIVGGGNFGGGKESGAIGFSGVPLYFFGFWADVDWGALDGGGYWDSFGTGGGGVNSGGRRGSGTEENLRRSGIADGGRGRYDIWLTPR